MRRLFFKNIVTSSGPFRSKSLLGFVAGQGSQQDHHAGHLQRAAFFLATRCGIYGICQIAEAGIARGVANLETPGAWDRPCEFNGEKEGEGERRKGIE